MKGDPILTIDSGTTRHTIVLDELTRWSVSRSRYYSTILCFKDGTTLEIYGDHDIDLADAVTEWKKSAAGLQRQPPEGHF